MPFGGEAQGNIQKENKGMNEKVQSQFGFISRPLTPVAYRFLSFVGFPY
jgi:hypothetical protein